jgi:glycosyltransferase involved in cell wall biosynthesis
LKVLWVTSGQLPAAIGGSGTAGGWIENLRRALEVNVPEIRLHIASWGSTAHAPFEEGNATYYAVVDPSPGTRGVRLARRWSHGSVPTRMADRCAAVAAAVEPDLIHVHGSESFLGMVLERLSTPAVISLQGIASALEDYTLAAVPPSALLRDVVSRPFLHGYGLIHDKARFKVRAAWERRTISLCSDFIGRSEWDRAVIETLRPGANYHHVDEVMNPAFDAAAWREDALASMDILCVASGSSMKGIEVMLRALSILRYNLGVPARLRVASHVHEAGIWLYWQRQIRRLRLQDAVSLLGALEPQQLAEQHVRTSVFVHPSHIDNSPNALCEAMLVGVPCVASFVGGVPTLVDDGRTGLLYPDWDPFLLAAKIRQVLSDRDLAVRLGQAAREAALVRHDPRAIARRTFRVYEEIITRSKSRIAGETK